MSRVPVADPFLGFVLDLCNTYDLLEDPPDRLTIPLIDRIAALHGVPGFELTPADLEPVREVRNHLYAVFAAPSPLEQARVLNTLFATHTATPRLLSTTPPPTASSPTGASAGEGWRIAATGGDGPVARLAIVSADALARAIADGSADRLRTCAGDPCRCVYVDRTKANRQRYCCELCNDRMASAAYRRRKR